MNIHVRFPLGFALSVLAATAAQARGPSPQPWLMYPVKAMDTCRAGTAPPKIAARCDDLLGAYSRELEACVPMRRGGPVVGGHQVALEQASPDCTAAAAVVAAGSVK
jgi:hypothetical protein